MDEIPDSYRDLLESEAVAVFVTLHPNGMPHPTPVWVGYDPGSDLSNPWEEAGDPAILVNTATGRQKHVNASRDERVAGTVVDPEDPYRYLTFQGRVVEMTTEGATAHIDALANRYMGVETYPNHGDEAGERIIIRIRPEQVLTG